MNNSISPKVTALHPADLESGDSGAIESMIKHCMDAKARYSPLGPRLFRKYTYLCLLALLRTIVVKLHLITKLAEIRDSVCLIDLKQLFPKTILLRTILPLL